MTQENRHALSILTVFESILEVSLLFYSLETEQLINHSAANELLRRLHVAIMWSLRESKAIK